MSSPVKFSSRSFIIVASLLGLLGSATPALALQPLSDFLAGARKVNLANRQAAQAAELQENQALGALGRALPTLGVRGQYTRNQYEVSFEVPANLLPPGLSLPSGPIQPYDQLDAFFQLDVPVIDVSTWVRAHAARQNARAARSTVEATRLEVEKQVARNYYQLLGAYALEESSARALAAAESNHDVAAKRLATGVATQLDVARAQAEVERSRQNGVDAQLLIDLTTRALSTLTGVQAEGEAAVDVADDLHEEQPLADWERTPADRIPVLQASLEQSRAASSDALSTKLLLLPTLSLNGLEHVTNANGFQGGNTAAYSVTLQLNWHLDLTTVAAVRAARQQAEIARLQSENTKLQVRDALYGDWQRVHDGIAKSRAARAQAEAAALAEKYAEQRYTDGVGTQLDVVQAQRDAYAAEVARIQADADLHFARALLRLDAGHEPGDGTAR